MLHTCKVFPNFRAWNCSNIERKPAVQHSLCVCLSSAVQLADLQYCSREDDARHKNSLKIRNLAQPDPG